MREPPRVDESQIRKALHAEWGLSVESLAFLPLGADSASSVYRVQAEAEAPYFAKLRAHEGFSEKSLAVPRYLVDQGAPHVFAPLVTGSGALWVSVDGFALTLYPFIDGRSGADAGLAAQHWREFGALMRQVHGTRLPPDLSAIVPREAFVPSRRSLIEDLAVAVRRDPPASPAQAELASFWRAREDTIRTVARRADELAEYMRRTAVPAVLCHADMHPWNVLIDASEYLWLVDWDEAILAPKERDLMFVVGGIGGDGVSPAATNSFLAGYGDAAIDPVALAYYRYAWAVQDIAAFGEQILLLPDQSEATRRDALRYFVGQFAPQNIVSLAMASDNTGVK